MLTIMQLYKGWKLVIKENGPFNSTTYRTTYPNRRKILQNFNFYIWNL